MKIEFYHVSADGMRRLDVANPLAQDQAEIARRKAAAPLRPTKPQAAPDCGLFSDDAAQVDLCDLINGSRK